MNAKRGFWSIVGKVLWTVISVVFRIAAKLGSTWARKKLDKHKATRSGSRVSRVSRVVHPSGRTDAHS